MNHKSFRFTDIPSQNISQYFGECINFIKENDKILLHCNAGLVDLQQLLLLMLYIG